MIPTEETHPVAGTCDCGEVTVRLARRPGRINACPCEYCSRIGARWSYMPGPDVWIDGATIPYRRATRSIEFRRCEICGIVTHWQLHGKPANRDVGVNMANFGAADLHDIPVVVDP